MQSWIVHVESRSLLCIASEAKKWMEIRAFSLQNDIEKADSSKRGEGEEVERC